MDDWSSPHIQTNIKSTGFNPGIFSLGSSAAASSSSHPFTPKPSASTSTSNRYLSGTLAYGNQYWSYAKVAWMQPINNDTNNPLYLSLDFMNHLHSSDNHSRELGAGLVYRMHTGVDKHLGMGGFYRYYVSWNNLKHWTPRVAIEYGNQDWLLTSNYYFKGNGSKNHDTLTKAHPYFGDYFMINERISPGFDVIADYRWSNINLQGFGYRYQQEEGRENLLNQGLGLEMAYHYALGQDRTAKPFVKYTRDSKHGSLWNIGFKLSMGHEKNRPMATSDPDSSTDTSLFEVIIRGWDGKESLDLKPPLEEVVTVVTSDRLYPGQNLYTLRESDWFTNKRVGTKWFDGFAIQEELIGQP